VRTRFTVCEYPEAIIKIRDHLRFYSNNEKTTFKQSLIYDPKIVENASKLSINKSFVQSNKFNNKIYFLRKRLSEENIKIYLQNLENRTNIPKTIQELVGVQAFRSFDIDTETCDCSCFWKLGYCKHSIAFQIIGLRGQNSPGLVWSGSILGKTSLELNWSGKK